MASSLSRPPSHQDPTQHTLRIGRLRLWNGWGWLRNAKRGYGRSIARTETKLRQLGERADKFKMMQRALKQAGIERATSAMALFDRGPRKIPLIGKVVGVGLVDEITDRTWIVIDAVDGRVHYAELGRLAAGRRAWSRSTCCSRRSELAGRPSPTPRLDVLSAVSLEQTDRLRRADLARSGHTLEVATRYPGAPGFVADVQRALGRSRSLAGRAASSPQVSPADVIAPNADMMRASTPGRDRRLVRDLSRHLNSTYIHTSQAQRISGVYDRAITTPAGQDRRHPTEDTFTLAPWKPALEPFEGPARHGNWSAPIA